MINWVLVLESLMQDHGIEGNKAIILNANINVIVFPCITILS